MATEIDFNGRKRIEPGAYYQRKGGTEVVAPASSFGNTLIIDMGLGLNYGGGAGINGELTQGKNAIYKFEELTAYQNFIGGGEIYDIGLPLFRPDDFGVPGVDTLYYAKAAKTYKTTMGIAWSSVTGVDADLQPVLTAIDILKINNRGSGYAVSDTISIALGSGSTTTLTVDAIDGSGGITQATITAGGSTTDNPNYINTQFATSGAGVNAEFIFDYGLGAVNILNGGTNYDSSDEAIVLGGTGVAITISETAGVIDTVTVDSAGSKLFTIPDIIIARDEQSTSDDSGYFIVSPLTEGFVANGETSNSKLIEGFAMEVVAGTIDTDRFVIKFYRGTFRGFDENRLPYDNTLPSDTTPELIAESIEFATYSELIAWTQTDLNFKNNFVVDPRSRIGTGSLDDIPEEILLNVGLNLAYGGGEVFTNADLDELLEEIDDLDVDFILSTKFGATLDGAPSAENFKILTFVNDPSTQNLIQLVVGGGKDKAEFEGTNGSVETAALFDSEAVSVVHSDIQVNIAGRPGLTRKNVLYHAALMLGREAGLEPQVPLTRKEIGVGGVIHEMKLKEREKALQSGVLHTFLLGENFVVNQGINTLQGAKNKQLLLPNGQSFEKSMRRIDALIQKELIAQSRAKGYAGGSNLNLASPATIEEFTNDYLSSRVAVEEDDNLIIAFRNVNVKFDGDSYFVTFEKINNSPVNKIFFTGITVTL